MTHISQLITLSDGRTLEVAACGDSLGRAVLFHHGTPGSALFASGFDRAAAERGYRLLTTSRAGYGRSSRLEGRTVASVVDDSRQTLNHFGVESYMAVGWSGGGPHALACAATDAPRCRGAISLAGVAPRTDAFDWTDGMGPENVEEFALALQGGEEYELHIKTMADGSRNTTEANVIERFGGLLSEPDKIALGDENFRFVLAAAMVDAGTTGHYGFLDDDQVFVKEWGFDLGAISVPTEIWYGDQDLMVPPSHGKYLVSKIRGATEFHRASDGHISIITAHLDELFDHLDALTS